jgi:mannuronan 5-epimerase
MYCSAVYFTLPLVVFLLHFTFYEYGESSSNNSIEPSGIQFIGLGYASLNASSEDNNGCVSYNRVERTITISCGNVHLTDLNKEINDPHILVKNYNGEAGVWFLNASMVISKNSTLIIDPADTKWLKIAAGGGKAHSIEVSGGLKIDSVKVTSWDPKINDYVKFRSDKMPAEKTEQLANNNKVPRPYIFINSSTGTNEISNSELAYLGYDCNDYMCHGLTFRRTTGIIVNGNNIHHNNFGLYSSELGNSSLENNHVHHNYAYGFDPHTASHDLMIRNNTVHDNGSIGIICSLDCYSITIVNNTVFNNTKAGVMLSRHTYNSIVSNNTVSNESTGVSISESYLNEIRNNTILDISNGIDLKASSYENIVLDNKIESPLKYGVRILGNTTGNILESNTVTDIIDSSDAISIAKGLTDVNMLGENGITNFLR